MYNRKTTLPIDVKYNLNSANDADEKENPLNTETCNAILSMTLSLQEVTHQEASINITKAQEKQRKDYNRRHTLPSSLKAKDKGWLKNQKGID